MKRFSAVVLAGGKSSRMGKDKASVLINGRTLLDHQVATLRLLQPTELFVSLGDSSGDVPDGTTIVRDKGENLGPMGGVAAALARCTTPLLVVLAVDLPLMTTAFLRELLAGSDSNRGMMAAADGALEPLAAVYPTSLANVVTERIAASELSIQSLARDLIRAGFLQVRALTPGESTLFRNCNRPEDIAECQRALDPKRSGQH